MEETDTEILNNISDKKKLQVRLSFELSNFVEKIYSLTSQPWCRHFRNFTVDLVQELLLIIRAISGLSWEITITQEETLQFLINFLPVTKNFFTFSSHLMIHINLVPI